MTGPDFGELASGLETLMGRGVDEPLDDEAFGSLALEVFRHQFATNLPYRRYCEGRDATPAAVGHWTAIPPVPTTAFKHLRLVSGDPASVQRVFRTSGTSRGPGRRGEHFVVELGLYRAALLPAFRAWVLPDLSGSAGSGPAGSGADEAASAGGSEGGLEGGSEARRPAGEPRLPILSLVPSPDDVPDSSLGFMVATVMRRWGGEGSGWFVDPEAGLRTRPLLAALLEAEAAGAPVLVAATGFSLVHWMDAMDREGWRVRLPAGSRVMETGGFKGRSRIVEKAALYRGVEERMDVPPERIVNEYGMTELLSQFYEPVLREGEADGGPEGRRHLGPPWVRTRVLDPRSLEPVEPGRPGLLCHMDLANAGSVAHVLTEDLGVAVADGFRVLGRAEGAEARGCSIAMDELLERARG